MVPEVLSSPSGATPPFRKEVAVGDCASSLNVLVNPATVTSTQLYSQIDGSRPASSTPG